MRCDTSAVYAGGRRRGAGGRLRRTLAPSRARLPLTVRGSPRPLAARRVATVPPPASEARSVFRFCKFIKNSVQHRKNYM